MTSDIERKVIQAPYNQEMLKALIILGLFDGRTPGNGHHDYVTLVVADELLMRLGDLSNVEIKLDYDPQRMYTKVTAVRNARKELPNGKETS